MKLKAILLEYSKKSRKNMPQINGEDLPEAYKVLEDCGCCPEMVDRSYYQLKPSQEELKEKKVDKIGKDHTNAMMMQPLVISADDYIVDGHHRWGALEKYFPEQEVRCIRMNKLRDEAIDIYKEIEDKL